MDQAIQSTLFLNPVPRKVNAAQRFVVAYQSVGKISFTLSELTEETGLSPIAAAAQLKRLSQVVRVAPRADFFLILSPEQLAIGAPPVSWWLHAYFQQQQSPYYLALLSAAAEHGSSHQAVQTVQVITDKALRELKLGRIRVQFFVKKNIENSPTTRLPNAFAPLNVSTPEVTALDLIRYAYRIGGIGRATQAISGMASQFSKKGLRKALQADGEISTIQRLGFILEILEQHGLSKIVEEYLPKKLNRVMLEHHRPISPSSLPPVSTRWSVIINSDISELS